MKNKKRTYILVAILVAIVALGIGYAAVSTLLEIEGTATVLESDGVVLEFTGTPTNDGAEQGNSAAIDSNDPSKATCTVVLKNYGDDATCTYTVQVGSSDTTLSAKSLAISVYEDSGYQTAWSNGNNGSSDYFDITSSIVGTTLANGSTTTASVTVTLKKENTTGDDITETFYVKVVGDTQQN